MAVTLERNVADKALPPTVDAQPICRGRGVGDIKLDHLDAMLTDIGVWQHAIGSAPDRRHGYSIDDQARALIVAIGCRQFGIEDGLCKRMGDVSFAFLERAAISEGVLAGRFHNFCDETGHWIDSYGSDDSLGRTIWGLGVAHAAGSRFAHSDRVPQLLERSLKLVNGMSPLRATAFSILGLAACRLDDCLLVRLADRLVDSYRLHVSAKWHWYEDGLTYCNARLPLALLEVARLFPEDFRYASVAIESLDFLLNVMHNGKGRYSPIGNARLTHGGWFSRGEIRPPLFDQQPVDAGALVECCVAAYQATSEPRFRNAAHDAYAWYFGHNVHNVSIYDWSTGGVADGLTHDGLNNNMGAESVLSIWMARVALEKISYE